VILCDVIDIDVDDGSDDL
ncbi:hypothetical protein L195_g024276, partial [Trifolium pratense]